MCLRVREIYKERPGVQFRGGNGCVKMSAGVYVCVCVCAYGERRPVRFF